MFFKHTSKFFLASKHADALISLGVFNNHGVLEHTNLGTIKSRSSYAL